MVFRDPFTLELSRHIESQYPRSAVGVIYEKIEEAAEPEEGPSIYSVDIPEQLLKVLEKRGISRLYKFQYEAYKHILDGKNVVISAGTGTGKTEAFFLPLAKKILEEKHENPEVLLLYPTKALARDQVKRFSEYMVYGKLSAGIYDGDSPEHVRKRLALSPPPIIVTNPDMLHVGLVYSPYVQEFVKRAGVFVFDELHVYEGVLGSHIHHLVHRVKMVRGSKPQFVACSATIGNPKEFAESIFEEEFVEVKGGLRRRGTAVHILVSAGYLSRWSIATSIAKFLADSGMRFILFVDSQQLAEMLANTLLHRLGVNVMVHRAGLPHDLRRDVEQKLRDGAISGVVATPTLELGIDIGSLDAVVMTSPPPSYAKYLQRAGRAGRRRKGYVITVLGNEPIDAYYARNPEAFFNQELVPSVIEPLNEDVSKTHLVAYLLQARKAKLRDLPREWKLVIDELAAEGVVKRVGPYVVPIARVARRFFSERESIRSFSDQVSIIDAASDKVIGTRELPVAVLELYPGAVYFYATKPYRVLKLDLAEKKAWVRQLEELVEVYTKPLYRVDVADYAIYDERISELGIKAAYAKVLLEEVVYGYVVKDLKSGETLSINELESPVLYKYVTRAVLLKMPEHQDFDLISSAEAYHAIEHALISAAGITCGSGISDLGGISYPSGDIVIYDAAPGGSGLAKLLYTRLERTIRVAYEIMSKCNCYDGCPRCIYSPFCGNNNRVLSKIKALKVLNALFSSRAIVVEEPLTERYGNPLV